MIFGGSVVQHVAIVCAKGQICSCKRWGDMVIYMCQISFVHVNSATDLNRKFIWPLGDTNFIFLCWKYLSRVSEANEWEILSRREDKISIPTRPCNILHFCWTHVVHNIKYPISWLHYIPSNRNGKIENWQHLSPHVSSEKVSYDSGCNSWVTSLTYSNNTTKGKEPPERLQSKRKNRG